MDEAKDLLQALPEHEGKLLDGFNYSPVTVTMSETTGVLILGVLSITLFVAYQRLMKKYQALLEKSNSPIE